MSNLFNNWSNNWFIWSIKIGSLRFKSDGTCLQFTKLVHLYFMLIIYIPVCFFKAVKYGKEIYKINYEVTMGLAPKSHLGIIYLLLTLKGWFGYYIKSKRYNCLLTPQKKGNFQNYFAHVQDFTNHIPKKNLDVIYNGNQDLKKTSF